MWNFMKIRPVGAELFDVKYPLFLSDLNESRIFSIDF